MPIKNPFAISLNLLLYFMNKYRLAKRNVGYIMSRPGEKSAIAGTEDDINAAFFAVLSSYINFAILYEKTMLRDAIIITNSEDKYKPLSCDSVKCLNSSCLYDSRFPGRYSAALFIP
ncbi:MAG: hypothetical protein ACE5FT_02905 [Candidatus Nanoarchaeia archaeon]